MDCYRNMRDVKKTFLEFMDRVPFYGMVVACNDDPLLRRLLPEVQRRTVTYGTKRGSDFLIKLRKRASWRCSQDAETRATAVEPLWGELSQEGSGRVHAARARECTTF